MGVAGGVVILVDKTSPRCGECKLILPHHSYGCSFWTEEGERESRRILDEVVKEWQTR